MARKMVLGNGNISVCLDDYGQVRDFYFPYVGQENHVGLSQVHKIGVFVDGKMHWLDNGEWQGSLEYEASSMVSKLSLQNNKIGVSIVARDVVYNEKNIFLRSIEIKNHLSKRRQVKIFFNQQFRIGDTNHSDTAYFAGVLDSIIHYKGRRVFLVGGSHAGSSFQDYSIGFCGIEGKEGTWRDAEDGELSKNPIEHGVVDSVVSWQLDLGPNLSSIVYYWVAVGETYGEVEGLRRYIIEKTPEHLLESTHDFWKAWVSQVEISFEGLSEKVKKLFYDSLFVMKAHTDNRGGIVASLDSGNVQYGGDTYVYVWPRDACFTAWSFDLSGFHDVAKKFYTFAVDLLTTDGYVLHKYQPDKSLGSSWHPWVLRGKSQLAIQEDETAILLIGLWEHYVAWKDLEFIETIYNGFIKKAAVFMVEYKDNNLNLPLASYDLWEEKHVVSVFTSALVYRAIISAFNFAKMLGKDEDADLFQKEAEALRKAIIGKLWDENNSYFFKLSAENLERDANVDASSFYGIFRSGILSVDDPRLSKMYEKAVSALSRGNLYGGLARYEGDQYYKTSDESVGNPWPIVSLWFAEYKIAASANVSDLNRAALDIEWVASRANGSMLSEQLHPKSLTQMSATPLCWSHAEFVRTVIEYSEKRKLFVK